MDSTSRLSVDQDDPLQKALDDLGRVIAEIGLPPVTDDVERDIGMYIRELAESGSDGYREYVTRAPWPTRENQGERLELLREIYQRCPPPARLAEPFSDPE